MRDIKGEMREVLLRNNVDKRFFDNNVTLNECGVNSLSFIKMVVDLEDTFDVVFEDENLLLEKYANFNILYQSLLSIME